MSVSLLSASNEPYGGFLVARQLKSPPSKAGDMGDLGLIPRSGRSPGGGHGNPFRYACLENPMDTGGWWAIFLGVVKEMDTTQLRTTHTHTTNHKDHPELIPTMTYLNRYINSF